MLSRSRGTERGACQCAISPETKIAVHLYRNSAIIEWPRNWELNASNDRRCSTRNTISDLSKKSAKRLLFAIANAPGHWLAMVTLTFRWCPLDPKKVFRKWVTLMQKQGLCHKGWLWVLEFQERGVPHFHVLFVADELTPRGFTNPSYIHRISRNGKEISLLRGPFERRCVDAWANAVGDTSDEFLDFQNGGICEILQNADSASRYFGSYFAKHEQKTLPEGHPRIGRWWWCSSDQEPQESATATLKAWPFLIPFGVVFNKTELDGCLTNVSLLQETANLENLQW